MRDNVEAESPEDYFRKSINNNGYDKIKVANGIQQRSSISFFWSGVCVFWQFCKVLKGLSKKYNLTKIIKIN
jgi:mRNA deadenylase 3'-5' endonuclease subunit Ccr4